MDEIDVMAQIRPRPTAARPLLGMTLLLVEDSRYASEAMRLLCLKSGARIRRADCLGAARRHLSVYRPTVVIIDLGLPDGDGLELISELAQAAPRIPGIVGLSGEAGREPPAMAAGADEFLTKPIATIQGFQSMILSAASDGGALPPLDIGQRSPLPDPLAYRDDLIRAHSLLHETGDAQGATTQDQSRLSYLSQFLGGLARSAEDLPMAQAADALRRAAETGQAATARAARQLASLLDARLAEPPQVV